MIQLLLLVALSTALEIPSTANKVEPWPETAGQAFTVGNMLYVQLPEKRPKEFRIPRLANSIGKVRWLSDPQSDLTLWPDVNDWVIRFKSVPKSDGPIVVAIELDSELRRPDNMTATPDQAGVIVLPAKFAKTTGQKLRFEPQPHKNTVGYWAVEKDFATWNFTATKAGAYQVLVLQGCGKGQGGSQVAVRVGEQSVTFSVEDTGHFQNFKPRKIGTLNLKAGDQTLTLKAIKKAKKAVMDCREIRLIPVQSP